MLKNYILFKRYSNIKFKLISYFISNASMSSRWTESRSIWLHWFAIVTLAVVTVEILLKGRKIFLLLVRVISIIFENMLAFNNVLLIYRGVLLLLRLLRSTILSAKVREIWVLLVTCGLRRFFHSSVHALICKLNIWRLFFWLLLHFVNTW